MSILSVLHLAPCGECVLYDSEKEQTILSGSYDEMMEWKDSIETAEQMAANRQYFDNLRYERMALLVSAGHTKESAEEFLKKHMAYLFN